MRNVYADYSELGMGDADVYADSAMTVPLGFAVQSDNIFRMKNTGEEVSVSYVRTKPSEHLLAHVA